MIRVLAAAWLVVGSAVLAAVPAERREAPAYVAELLADLPAAAERLQPHSPVREAIAAGRLDEAREMLSFRPLGEASTPEGFPAYTPVGVIEVKRYPAYRKAAGMSFWPLFNHIQTRGIPMTAPVEMTGHVDSRGRRPMAFLYQNTSVGSVGPIDQVEVRDAAETVVASLGVRGAMIEDHAARARDSLEAWLAQQSEWRLVEGEAYRVFAYNSPMVPDGDKYWEAQLLLRPASKQ